MTKQEKNERKERNSVIKRNHSALRDAKVNVSVNKINDEITFQAKLIFAKNQAEVMHICIENNKSHDFIVNELVNRQFCKSLEHAASRLKRHIKYDKSSRIVSRSLRLS